MDSSKTIIVPKTFRTQTITTILSSLTLPQLSSTSSTSQILKKKQQNWVQVPKNLAPKAASLAQKILAGKIKVEETLIQAKTLTSLLRMKLIT